MSTLGKRGCVSRRVTDRRVIALEQEDVGTETVIRAEGGAIRLVHCVTASWIEEPPPSADGSMLTIDGSISTVVSRRGAKRLPYVVDAVTGRRVPRTCSALVPLD